MTYYLSTTRSCGDYKQLCLVSFENANVNRSETARTKMAEWVAALVGTKIESDTWTDVNEKNFTVAPASAAENNGGGKADAFLTIRCKPGVATEPKFTHVEIKDLTAGSIATRWATLLSNLGLSANSAVIVSAMITLHN